MARGTGKENNYIGAVYNTTAVYERQTATTSLFGMPVYFNKLNSNDS